MAQPPPEGPETRRFAAAPPPPAPAPRPPASEPPPLAPEPPPSAAVGPSVLRRRRVPILIATAVLILAGCGIGWAVAASQGSSPSAGPPASPTASATGSPVSPKAHKHPVTRGVITRESGSSWTLRTADGSTVTVTISDKTQFGAKQAPAQKSQFTVGTSVDVSGATKNGMVMAKRIRLADGKKPAPSKASGAPTPSTS